MPSANTENKPCIDIPDLAKFMEEEGHKGLDHWYEAWSPDSEASKAVVKIVLGQLGNDKSQLGTLPKQLKARFPNLTHLHLWGLELSETLPDLPPGLLCLDIRAAVALEKLPVLPTSLEQLVLEDNPKLAEVQLAGEAQALWDLSLRGCGLLGDAVLGHLLERTPNLRRLDASELVLLTGIPAWPVHLERIDLDRCTALTGLPEQWPPKLRRLGLRGASSLRTLPDFEDWPDYLDLAGAAGLTKLQQPKSGRTLFLYGSGVRVPPASEHGENAGENVAQRVRDYYADCELLGRGKVNRCKLLVLGNGSAGKTCLSAALVPDGDPKAAANMGSTHGVQFWPWQLRGVELPESKLKANVDVHVWDFGGQEIYHQTHRLFMAKGAVFLIAWNPAQEGHQPDPTPEGYQDVWRPIEYWVDFVMQACPWGPRIAIVRTHAAQWGPGEQERLRALAESRSVELECFVADSVGRSGQLGDIQDWLSKAVAGIVESQGTAVPSHWMIAQEMVESWFPKQAPGKPVSGRKPRYLEMSKGEFEAALVDTVGRSLKAPELRKLAAAFKADPGCLGGRRLDRLLDFLTHSGWIYWDPKLFQERVIVSQSWALDGIYTALDRRPDSKIYRALADANGIFTREILERLIWEDAGLDKPQQGLLISFMVQAGVAIELVNEAESRWGRAGYLSLEHLRRTDDWGLSGGNSSVPDAHSEEFESLTCHRFHWNRVLAGLGRRFGADGEYTRDGFFVRERDGRDLRIGFQLNEAMGIGAKFSIMASGPEAEERAQSLRQFVMSRMPLDPLASPPASALLEERAKQSGLARLFISYAWNPSADQMGLVGGSVAQEFEAPVDRIEVLLKPYSRSIQVERDRTRVRSGDSIPAFIALVRDCDYVLVVHSDKYWRSWYCMAEMTGLLDSARTRDAKLFKKVALFVEHPTSGIGDNDRVKELRAFWKTAKKYPTCMKTLRPERSARTRIISFFDNDVQEVHGSGRKYRWDPRSPEGLDQWLLGELRDMGISLKG